MMPFTQVECIKNYAEGYVAEFKAQKTNQTPVRLHGIIYALVAVVGKPCMQLNKIPAKTIPW